MPRERLPDSDLEAAVQAYYDCRENKSEAARSLGLKRMTYMDRLDAAQERFGITLGKVVDGQIEAAKSEQRQLPKKGHVQRYILTSIQNNTHLHPGFKNLLAYVEWLDALDKGACELLIGTYSYNKAKYGAKAVKNGTLKEADKDALWYDPDAEPYIIDHSVELAPGLVWCGEQNILPTNRHPLTSFEDYNGRKSNIVPHAKIAMQSVASMADEATKFNYATGTITQRNYLQKRAGILAEQKHSYGATLVEIDETGSWWVRQLHIDENDQIMDCGPDPYPGIVVKDGKVEEMAVTEGIYWADGHVAEQHLWVRDLAWGSGGMLDVLRPRHQFIGDGFSMRNRSPHEMKNFKTRYEKYVEGEEKVEDEVSITTDFFNLANRSWCETVIIPANHDRHLDRWLNDADPNIDLPNAKYYHWLKFNQIDAIDRGDKGFNIMEFAMRERGLDEDVRFLSIDESYIVAGVENGLHGDLGPNGARGSTTNLTKLGRPLNKGHDHTAAIRDGVYSAGACSLDFPYMMGPTSHSISHILTFENGARTIVTMWAGKWRA